MLIFNAIVESEEASQLFIYLDFLGCVTKWLPRLQLTNGENLIPTSSLRLCEAPLYIHLYSAKVCQNEYRCSLIFPVFISKVLSIFK